MPRCGGASVVRIALLVCVGASFVAFFASGLHRYLDLDTLKSGLDTWQRYAREHPVVAPLGFFLAYTLMGALALPGALLRTLLAGALFGLVPGTLLVWIGSALGALATFLFSRLLLRDWLRARLDAKLGMVDAGLRRDGSFYLLSMLLIPAFPYALVNVLMGITTFPATRFFCVSLVGLLPSSALYVNAGRTLSELQSLDQILAPWTLAAFLALALLPLIANRLLRLRQRRERVRVPCKPPQS